MKIISLLQPWATLLVQGHKTIETRSWQTNYRGPCLIHASGSLTKKFDFAPQLNPKLMCEQPRFEKYIKAEDLLFGKIVGAVEIGAMLPTEEFVAIQSSIRTVSEDEYYFGDYTSGRWAWQTCNNVEFSIPTDFKGSQGIRDFKGQTHCRHCDNGSLPVFNNMTAHLIGGDIVYCLNRIMYEHP